MPLARRVIAVVSCAAVATVGFTDTTVSADQVPAVSVGFGPGLRVPDVGSPCVGLLELVVPGTTDTWCSHGGDATPEPSTQPAPDTTPNATSTATPQSATAPTSPPPPPPAGAVFCYGDGASGPRVELLYVHATGVPDRYAAVFDELHAIAAGADAVFNRSAQETGATRHLRFAVTGSCRPVIHDVAVPATGDDAFSDTIAAVRAAGFTRVDRKYVMFVDSGVYCGIATMPPDSRPWSNNLSLFGTGYARVDRGCWSPHVTAHEILHELGGVHDGAPHSSGAGHCYDEDDVMCYADGGPYFSNGGALTYPCTTSESRLDCGHDDYYLAGDATGGYLLDHWNTAQSAFLETRDGTTSSPGPALSPPFLAAPPPASQEWDGTAMPFEEYEMFVDTAAGEATATVITDNEITVTVRLEDGTVLGRRHNTGSFTIPVVVGRTRIFFDVADGIASNYSLTFSYPPR